MPPAVCERSIDFAFAAMVAASSAFLGCFCEAPIVAKARITTIAERSAVRRSRVLLGGWLGQVGAGSMDVSSRLGAVFRHQALSHHRRNPALIKVNGLSS